MANRDYPAFRIHSNCEKQNYYENVRSAGDCRPERNITSLRLFEDGTVNGNILLLRVIGDDGELTIKRRSPVDVKGNFERVGDVAVRLFFTLRELRFEHQRKIGLPVAAGT